MENNCLFVSSRGLLKSCDFHSNNPRSSWGFDNQYLMDMINGPNMFDGMSIYVCTDLLESFLCDTLPNIKHSFYLVCGDSDARVPFGCINSWGGNMKPLTEDVCLKILAHPKLIKWFIQNCIFTNEILLEYLYKNEKIFNSLAETKIFQLPIGIDYHTISNDPRAYWRDPTCEGYTPKYQEMLLKKINQESKPFYQRTLKIFVHMTMGESRKDALSKLPQQCVEHCTETMYRTNVWKKMSEYAFVLSPYGNGPDCHRHWEILCLGGIPIIKTFGTDKMFEDLPVLIVKEWEDVTEELLQQTIKIFKDKYINYNKLSLKYWVDQFSPPTTKLFIHS